MLPIGVCALPRCCWFCTGLGVQLAQSAPEGNGPELSHQALPHSWPFFPLQCVTRILLLLPTPSVWLAGSPHEAPPAHFPAVDSTLPHVPSPERAWWPRPSCADAFPRRARSVSGEQVTNHRKPGGAGPEVSSHLKRGPMAATCRFMLPAVPPMLRDMDRCSRLEKIST